LVRGELTVRFEQKMDEQNKRKQLLGPVDSSISPMTHHETLGLNSRGILF
jgi:hypothetical protein